MAIKFGTSGWRAVIADEFTFNNVERVIQAIACYVKKEKVKSKKAKVKVKKVNTVTHDTPKVIVGYDTRFLSKECAGLTAEVLARNNIRVMLSDRDVPTPVIAFHIIKQKASGGINFTASHNPPEYNGIKFSPRYGGPAPKEATNAIEKLIPESVKLDPLTKDNAKKYIKQFDAKPDYLKRIKQLVRFSIIKKAKLKIVIDCLHGTARGYLDDILSNYAGKLWALNRDLNPIFGGNPPEPKPEYIAEMIKTIKKNKAHLGLACDGDADRFGIVDCDGTFINPNQVLCLLFDHLVNTRGKLKYAARTMSTTHMLDKIAVSYGVKVIETPVGFKYIGEVLAKGNCLIGGEESGGLSINGHVPEKDGILACLLIAEMVALRKQNIGRILAQLYKKYGAFYTDRIDMHTTDKQKSRLIDILKNNPPQEFSGLKVNEVKTTDGYKFILEDGSWVMYRVSGTEPIVRCYMESSAQNKLKKLRLSAQKVII